MHYRLCNNGRAVLVTREPVIVTNSMRIYFDNIEDGYTAVVTTESGVFYRPIVGGFCEVRRDSFVRGAIKLTVIRDEDMKPYYLCDELFCVISGEMLVVTANYYEQDRLLSDLRVENNELRDKLADFEARLLHFEKEFERIYAGYDLL